MSQFGPKQSVRNASILKFDISSQVLRVL